MFNEIKDLIIDLAVAQDCVVNSTDSTMTIENEEIKGLVSLVKKGKHIEYLIQTVSVVRKGKARAKDFKISMVTTHSVTAWLRDGKIKHTDDKNKLLSDFRTASINIVPDASIAMQLSFKNDTQLFML